MTPFPPSLVSPPMSTPSRVRSCIPTHEPPFGPGNEGRKLTLTPNPPSSAARYTLRAGPKRKPPLISPWTMVRPGGVIACAGAAGVGATYVVGAAVGGTYGVGAGGTYGAGAAPGGTS